MKRSLLIITSLPIFTGDSILLPILLLCFISSIAGLSQNSGRSSFGETCGKTQRCDRRAWLGCFDEKCDCLKPEEMIYEPRSNKCVSKAGERCKFTVENLDGNTAFEVSDCVENSNCSPDGFCACKENFLEISNGTCIPSRKYGEACDDQLQCSSRLGLQCENSTCQCSNTTTFSQVQNQCVGLVGQECVKTKCSDNAACVLRSNKCHCIKGYFQDSEDKCTRQLGLFKNCTSDDQCLDTIPLKCTDGMCNCNRDVSVLYKGGKVGDNYPNAVCVGRANSPCILSRCVAGASCHTDYLLTGAAQVQQKILPNYAVKKRSAAPRVALWTTAQLDDYVYSNPSSSEEAEITMQGLFPGHTLIPVQAKLPTLQQICLCNEGYTYSKSGTCGRAFGAPCIKDECVDGLVCKGNHCSCRYPHQEFSGLTLSCRSRIRGPCTINEDCIDNTICNLYNNRTYGVCSCQEGYIENMRRECDVQYGGECVKNNDCDSIAGLVCLEGKCECGGFAKFSKDERKCLSLIGGECTSSGSGIMSCVENAHCSMIHGDSNSSVAIGSPGSCICNDGFSVSPDYTCGDIVFPN